MLDLSFMEAVQGCSKTVTFQTDMPCNTCGMYIVITYKVLYILLLSHCQDAYCCYLSSSHIQVDKVFLLVPNEKNVKPVMAPGWSVSC